jgi:ATP-dependent RNA helicase RhlE
MSLEVIRHEVPTSHTPGMFQQFVYLISEQQKAALVVNILTTEQFINTIVYVRTNFAADQLAEQLNRAGITAESIHDNKRNKSTSVLVITESAASSISIMEVTAIINYDLPVSAETYTKRLNHHRNAAGLSTKTFSFCDKSEQGHLSNINRVLLGDIEVVEHCFD